MSEDLLTLRRVVLGLSSEEDMPAAIEAATTFATALKLDLLCLLVEQEDLINYASLPFAKAFGPGGLSSILTVQSVESHFNRLFRDIEQMLAKRCSLANVAWQVRRPQGEYFREIVASLEPGDTVVLSGRDLRSAGHLLLNAARQLLGVATAVVLPPRRPGLTGSVIAIDGEQTLSIAREIARARGTKVQVFAPTLLPQINRPVFAFVASIGALDVGGEDIFLHSLANTGAMAVLVSDETREPGQQRR